MQCRKPLQETPEYFITCFLESAKHSFFTINPLCQNVQIFREGYHSSSKSPIFGPVLYLCVHQCTLVQSSILHCIGLKQCTLVYISFYKCTAVQISLTQCVLVYINVHQCTAVYNIEHHGKSVYSLPPFTAVYSSVQQSKALHLSVNPCTTVYNSAQQVSTEYNSVHQCTVYCMTCLTTQQSRVQASQKIGWDESLSTIHSTLWCNGVVMLCCVHRFVRHCTALYSTVQHCTELFYTGSTITERGYDDLPRLPRPHPPPPLPSPSILLAASLSTLFNCRHP